MSGVEFREESHTYLDRDTGGVLPGITDLLKRGGLVDDQWYTDEGRERGKEVHRLTADYDLRLLGCAPERVGKTYRPYLLGHVQASTALQPAWTHVEEALAHARYRFAGRPDRVGTVYGAVSVLEIKTGGSRRATYYLPAACPDEAPQPIRLDVDPHGVQTALQAILVAPEMGLPAEAINRYVEYLQKTGRWKVEQFRERRDFAVAYHILERFCRRVA